VRLNLSTLRLPLTLLGYPKARDNEIIVTVGHFCAVYFKPPGQPQLILRSRADTGDHELLAQVWQAAVKRRASSAESCDARNPRVLIGTTTRR
jgi:hypothetical protein